MTFEEDIKIIIPLPNEEIYDCLMRIHNKNSIDKQKVKDAIESKLREHKNCVDDGSNPLKHCLAYHTLINLLKELNLGDEK